MSNLNRFPDYMMQQQQYQQPYAHTAYQNHHPYQHNQYGAPYARPVHVQEHFAARPDRAGWSGGQPHIAATFHGPPNEGWTPQPPATFNPGRGASPDPQYRPQNSLQQSQNGLHPSSPFSSPYRQASPALNALQHSHTRASPSISRRLGPPPIASSSSRSPTSRGVSPVGSQFSTGTEAVQLNHLGLPITKARNYKVKLPVEHCNPSDESTKPSKIKRTPVANEQHSHDEVAECFFRSRDPHPEEHLYREPLPDCVDIYLPNDWQALKDALFEERLARLGITREYLKHIETVLPAKSDSEATTPSPPTDDLSSQFPAPPGAQRHQRAGSLFIPQNRLFAPLFRANAAPFRPGHQAHMSIAGFTDPRKPLLQESMHRQMLQLGERAKSLIPQQAAVQRHTIEEEAEDEAEDNARQVSRSAPQEALPQSIERRPARSMSLKELNAGFGLDLDSESEGPAGTKAPVVPEETEQATTASPAGNPELARESISAGMEDGQPSAGSQKASHEARRSLSTPNLQTLARELAAELHHRDSPASEHGYVAENSHSDDDLLSNGSEDYSNPSDELAARQRRDRSTSKANSKTMSPIAVLRSPDNWMERNDSEDIISNPSDEEHLTRRPSWAQLSSAQQGIPFLLHAPSGSTSSAQPDRKPTLNAAAPEFVIGASFNLTSTKLGSFSSSAASIRQAQPSLNAFAAEFKPGMTAGSGLPQPQPPMAQVPLVSPRLVFPEAEGDPFAAPPKAKGSVEIWLSDTSEAHTPAPAGRGPLAHGRAPIDNIRSFKFPPSPVLHPISPPSQVSPLTQRAPQLPPLGTIGRNTLLDKTLQDFTIVSPQSRNIAASAPEIPDSSNKYRKPIPSFEPAASSLGMSPNTGDSHDTVLAQASGLASDVSISEFGGRRNSSTVKPRAPRPLPVPPLDMQDQAAPNDAVETSGITTSRTSVSVSEDGDNESDAALSDNEFVYSQADNGLSKTWRLFESILDRKLDVLRLDVFNNSTPLPPPPITAEAQDALTVAIIEAIKHEIPAKGSGSSSGNGDINTSLLVAIHETQEMLQDLQSRGSDSIKEIIDTLQTRPSTMGSPPETHETLQIVVENAIAKHSDTLRMPPLDVPALTAALAEAVKPQLYTLMDLATDKRETAALIVAHLEPRLAALKPGQIDEEGLVKALTDAGAQHISRNVSEAVQNGLEALLPKLIPLPSTPIMAKREAASLDASVTQLQDSITVSQMQLIQRLDDMSSNQQDYRELMEQKVELDGLLAQSRAEYARERSEKTSQQVYFQSERQRFERELAELRQSVVAREQQVDLLRQELLNRATKMDDEQVRREEQHVNQLNDFRTVCGGMEAELAILKAHLQESKAEKTNLVDAIEKGQDRLHDQERDHHAMTTELKERLASALAELASKTDAAAKMEEELTVAKRESLESQSSCTLLQGRLTELRAEKASLETRVAVAYHDLATAKQNEVASKSKLDEARKEMAALQIEVRKKEDEYRQTLAQLQEENSILALVAAQAQQTSLGLLLSHKEDVPGENTALVYESCLVVQDRVFFSSAEVEQDLHKHPEEPSESSIESIPLASDVSSDTLQMSQDESMLSKDIGDHSYVSTKSIPTPDDSGWYS